MTVQPDQDLQALWASRPAPDPDALLAQLKRNNAEARRLNQIGLGVGIASGLFVIFSEIIGILTTRGALSVVMAVLILGSWLHYRQAKRRLSAAFSREPQAMVRFMIDRARSALFLARSMYSCQWIGLVAGFAASRLTRDGDRDILIPDQVLGIIIVAVLAAFIAMTAYGVRLARRKVREIAVLQRYAEALSAEGASISPS